MYTLQRSLSLSLSPKINVVLDLIFLIFRRPQMSYRFQKFRRTHDSDSFFKSKKVENEKKE